MRNVGNNNASSALEAPGAAVAVLAVMLVAGFSIASGCGKHEESVLQGDAKRDGQSMPVSATAIVTETPTPGRE